MFYVYKYTSPSGKFYIGITDNLQRRQEEHKKKEFGCKDDNSKFANAIRKYSFNNFKYEVLESGLTEDDANFLECLYIIEFDSFKNGYNSTTGGDRGHAPKKLTEELVLEINKDLIERKLSYTELESKYKITRSIISRIKNRKAWSYLLGEVAMERKPMNDHGENNSQSKLKNEQVIEIRKKLMEGVSRKDLMKEYNVSKTLIQLIATGQMWKDLMDGYVYTPKELNGNAKLNPEIVAKLKKDLKNGMYRKDVAQKYGISKSAVDQICAGKTWKEVEAES